MNAVAVVEKELFNKDQLALIKSTIAKDATNDELALFINQCKRTGLDPFTKQIYFIKDKNGKVTIATAIDGLRLVAERSEKYEGQTEPQWCGADGIWKDVWLSKEIPAAAKIGVYKQGFKAPVYGIAVLTEYAQLNYKNELPYMWAKMPSHMLAKVAEALAFRKAFPNDLSGLYATEEVTQIIEQHEARELAPVNTFKELTENNEYVFEGGKFQGKKFSEVETEEFLQELGKYKSVPQITPKLQGLIDRMDKFNNERIELQKKELAEKLAKA